MKRTRLTTILLILIVSALLSSCSGGALRASSWPGVTVDQDKVYVSYKTDVLAVGAKDGSLIWRYPSEPSNRQMFYAPPAVSEDLIVVGDYFNVLYGLDPANGSEKWSFAGAEDRFVAGASIEDEKVFVPSADNTLYAFDTNGNEIWTFQTQGALWAHPVLDDELVYQASMDHYIYALDVNNGSEAWSFDMGGAVVAAPLYEDGVLYAGSLANEMIAVNAENGKLLWRFPVAGAIWGRPAYHDGMLYFGDVEGNFYAVSADTGKEVWKKDQLGAIVGNIAKIPEGVAFATEENGLHAFSYDGATKLWSLLLNGTLYGGPVETEEYLIVSVTNGDHLLVAVDFLGNQRWVFSPSD